MVKLSWYVKSPEIANEDSLSFKENNVYVETLPSARRSEALLPSGTLILTSALSGIVM